MNQTTGPSPPKIVRQAMVRIRNEVKNGTMTSPSRMLRHFPARNARK